MTTQLKKSGLPKIGYQYSQRDLRHATTKAHYHRYKISPGGGQPWGRLVSRSTIVYLHN
jgi:hypothetical protein